MDTTPTSKSIDPIPILLALAESATFEEARGAVIRATIVELERLHFEWSLLISTGGMSAYGLEELENKLESLRIKLQQQSTQES